MANRTTGGDRKPVAWVRKEFEDQLRQGAMVKEALATVGRSQSWYDVQRKDAEWAAQVDRIKAYVSAPERRPNSLPDFPEFCEKYLGMKLWPHQLAWFDVLEGREPRWVHPSMTYSCGSAGASRVLINVPPNHAKTMTISIAYVLWKLLGDTTMTVLLISKTQEFAKKILWAIKQRLTHPRYADLQLAFGPPDGFKASADMWTANRVYLWGDQRDSGEKDPSIEAVGMGGQIYGNRARLILVDDAIVLSNASQWQSQQDWIRQEVASRIGPDDQIVVVGTRVAPIDLYRELRNPEHYADEEVPWTIFSMPAVLEYADEIEDWVTLWPITDEPFSDRDRPRDDGFYERWTGKRLSKVRNEVGARRWGLVYQQQDMEDDATFDHICVRGSIDGFRGTGILVPGAVGVPANMQAPYVICTIDPAVKGNTAACVYAVDRRTGKRYILDMKVITGPTPKQMREMIEMLTTKYTPHEWIVEANAYQLALVQDETITAYLAARGIPMKPHYTNNNKMDDDYGVASMSVLFGTTAVDGQRRVHQGDNLISLPNQSTPGIKMLVDELIAWTPNIPTKHRRQDTVMALWFAELRARELILTATRRQFFSKPNSFSSVRDLERRYTVNLDDVLSATDEDRQGSFL